MPGHCPGKAETRTAQDPNGATHKRRNQQIAQDTNGATHMSSSLRCLAVRARLGVALSGSSRSLLSLDSAPARWTAAYQPPTSLPQVVYPARTRVEGVAKRHFHSTCGAFGHNALES
jgi:hypothetical protein